jgi:hypothetical protein
MRNIEARPFNPVVSKRHTTKRRRSLQVAAKAANKHLHGIINQFSLINLGCFKLRTLVERKLDPLKELDTIETAATEGAALLDKLNESIQVIIESSSNGNRAAPHLSTAPNNVYHLGDRREPRR